MWLSQIEKMSSKHMHFSRKRAFSRIKFYLTQLFRPLFPGLFRHGAVPIGRWLSAVRRLEALASIFEGYEAESSAENDDFEEEERAGAVQDENMFRHAATSCDYPSLRLRSVGFSRFHHVYFPGKSGVR